ncbi:ZPR1 zinc finger domain-containing protein [Candidatus Woesearchaeota archaeon]|nr:ZPR1 zinc finger domain-containing protein [Candidatus Woesearchaeota archaeon]
MKTDESESMPEFEELDEQPCPICREKKMILTEREEDIPYFGRVYLFSMTCAGCKFHKADVECVDQKEPVRCTIEVDGEEDMKIRVVKSSQATVRIPHVATIEPGVAAQGYITNIEGVLSRVKRQIESLKEDGEEEDSDKARVLAKRINRVILGQERIKVIIDDPSGNSAIISDKTIVDHPKLR